MSNLRGLWRKEIIVLCSVVFLADVVAGIVSPTFSLYAKSLGVSVVVIGALGGVMGLTQILAAVPIGMISDTRGRKAVISAGMLFFAASSFLYTIVPDVYLLFPYRMLAGLAMIATFFVGMAHIGDIVTKQERGLAIGVYSTALALGFTIGPIIGGMIAAAYGYAASYYIAAAIALCGFALAQFGLSNAKSVAKLKSPAASLSSKLGLMLRNPNILVAGLANLVFSTVFSGAVTNFFPLYAASLSIGDAVIGSMFALRAFMSMLTRIPTGLLTTRVASKIVMVIALGLAMAAMFAIAINAQPVLLTLFLAVEGVSFGMFLTSGQAFVIEHSTEADRGTAIGIYSMTGSIGATLGPFVFGVVANLWGLAMVFQVTGLLVMGGIVALVFVNAWQRRTLPVR
ncbi:MAG: MFS transporter [Chloroflexi bacterium]|nr:MFS transporter [Chloroflexota bacterium]